LKIHRIHRAKLLKLLPKNSVALIPSGSEVIRNRDVEYPFRAKSDFLYLTGFEEPDSMLLLIKTEKQQSVVFLRDKDPQKEIWDGRRLGVKNAKKSLGIDLSFSIDSLEAKTAELIQGCEQIFISYEELENWSPFVNRLIKQSKQQVRKGVQAPAAIADLDQFLHEMRLFKSAAEIKKMRKAAQISVSGHLAAMKAVADCKYEYQLQAVLEADFKRSGASRNAFNSIVASKENACILHYTENSAKIKKRGLVLVDAGAEFKGYAGDITTTFPARGKFTKSQAKLYSLVLKAQRAAIEAIAPGVSYDEMHHVAIKVITTGLVELGLLKGKVNKLIEKGAYQKFFMHGTGHWLGMDVHDVGCYRVNGRWRKFKPGMVVTVEPGLYISSNHKQIAKKWHNIGIRIEDDVLVTPNGHEVLTAGLPRTVKEIEAYMAKNQKD
jgi:Xaa-Pro aminopeptidase